MCLAIDFKKTSMKEFAKVANLLVMLLQKRLQVLFSTGNHEENLLRFSLMVHSHRMQFVHQISITFIWMLFEFTAQHLSKNVFINHTPRRVREELLPNVFSLIATWSSVFIYLIYKV